MISALVAAAAVRAVEQGERPHVIRLTAGLAALPAALLLASPYLVLDWHTVAADLGGEVASQHLGATGGGALDNLHWYLAGPLLATFGLPGLVAIAVGVVVAVLARRRAWVAVVAPAGLFMVVICSQSLVWARWVVPVLPFAALAVAVAIVGGVDVIRVRWPRLAGLIAGVLAVVVGGPMLVALADQIGERQGDTRTEATRWLVAHAPPGAPVAAEHIALDVIFAGHPLRFPMGNAGCIDGMAFLTGHTTFAQVGHVRGNVAKADFGTVPPAMRATCRAPYVILSDYDRYLARGTAFSARNRRLSRHHCRRPRGGDLSPTARGAVGGPVVRIVAVVPVL